MLNNNKIIFSPVAYLGGEWGAVNVTGGFYY